MSMFDFYGMLVEESEILFLRAIESQIKASYDSLERPFRVEIKDGHIIEFEFHKHYNTMDFEDVDHISLDLIPKSIRNLTKLIVLDLADNNLNTIPKELTHLNQLKILNLQKNHIDANNIDVKQIINQLERQHCKVLL